VRVTDRETAELFVGEERTLILEPEDEDATIETVDVGFSLEITPEVLNDDELRLQVTPDISHFTHEAREQLVVRRSEIDTTVYAEEGETLNLAGMNLDEVVFIPETGEIAGEIVGPEGEMLEEVEMQFTSLSEEGEVDSQGVQQTASGDFELELQKGEYLLELNKDGYIPVEREVEITPGGLLKMGTVEMEPLQVSGTVTNVVGEPLPEADIYLQEEDTVAEEEDSEGDGEEIGKLTAEAAGDGEFSIGSADELILPGSYTLSVERNGYLPIEVEGIELTEKGEVTGVEFPLELDRYGDALGDGNLTPADAVQVLRHVVGLEELDEEAVKRASVSNGTSLENGEEESDNLTIRDAVLILRKISGLVETFPAQNLE